MINNRLNLNFRKAKETDKELIWEIIGQGILRRQKDGSNQWQDGYPNIETIVTDIQKDYGYVWESDEKIIGYAAIIFEIEPAYEVIEGNWLSDNPYVVIHRVVVSEDFIGRGVAKLIFDDLENIALSKKIFSIKVDTNFDNAAMLKILEKLNYSYCGEVHFRGSPRKAFEKILNN